MKTVSYIIFSNKRKAGWLRSTAVERSSLTGELSLSYDQPAADG